jgi:hypothetical protein
MTKQLSEQLLLASKKLNKSKDMLEQFKKDYPTASSDIQYLENQISKLEEKYENLTKNKDKDWDTIQENYIKYCKTFSPEYLSGCVWYQILGDDFKTGYLNWKMNEFYSDNKEILCGGLSVAFLSGI